MQHNCIRNKNSQRQVKVKVYFFNYARSALLTLFNTQGGVISSLIFTFVKANF